MIYNVTKIKILLDSIFYWYYSKDHKAKKNNNKDISLIKKNSSKFIN